jgi:hypothetical protein
LQQAGIYQDVPIRRLVVRSPQDPVVKYLERDLRAQTEGTIHIVASKKTNQVQYSIVFAPFTGPGGALPSKTILGADELRQFLEEHLNISKSEIDEALSALNRKESASIFHVRLTKREAKSLGLA